MKILLDTHALLWLIDGDSRLSEEAKERFLDSGNALFFSAASLWEISIKLSLGKLELAQDWTRIIRGEMAANQIQWLPIEVNHCAELSRLPFLHRDPFDRILVAQSQLEKLPIVTRDPQIARYSVEVIW